LPENRIAQRPVERASSKLLHAKKNADGSVVLSDKHYFDLPDLLRAGDLLVLNNTKVLPCRFFVKLDGVGKEVEVLLIKKANFEQPMLDSAEENFETWEVLARPMKRLKIGKAFKLSESLEATAIGRAENNDRLLLKITAQNFANTNIESIIYSEAKMPIPPYIRGGHADNEDRITYQNVYYRA
jgi:S-adenosylmethionine:tRNA ribosyltransferase-isomerase